MLDNTKYDKTGLKTLLLEMGATEGYMKNLEFLYGQPKKVYDSKRAKHNIHTLDGILNAMFEFVNDNNLTFLNMIKIEWGRDNEKLKHIYITGELLYKDDCFSLVETIRLSL